MEPGIFFPRAVDVPDHENALYLHPSAEPRRGHRGERRRSGRRTARCVPVRENWTGQPALQRGLLALTAGLWRRWRRRRRRRRRRSRPRAWPAEFVGGAFKVERGHGQVEAALQSSFSLSVPQPKNAKKEAEVVIIAVQRLRPSFAHVGKVHL